MRKNNHRKTEIIGVRLVAAEKQDLETCARALGQTPSAILRMMAEAFLRIYRLRGEVRLPIRFAEEPAPLKAPGKPTAPKAPPPKKNKRR